MKPASKYCCEICGVPQRGNEWFLVTKDPQQDTLQILKWNNRLAEQPGVRHLCSAAHVEQLVSHWMMTGSLDYAWSRLAPGEPPQLEPANDVDGSFRLGELMLDRASFAALGERPDMLNSILEAIDGALQAAGSTRALLEEEEDEDTVPAYDA
jgi:hypothetical protein